MYKKAVPVTTTRPSDKVKQLVLPFKSIGFAYQSMPLSKVKQLVLLHQLIYFLPTTPYTQSRSWPTGDCKTAITHLLLSLTRHQKAVHQDICQSHFGTDGLVLFYTFQIPSQRVAQPLQG